MTNMTIKSSKSRMAYVDLFRLIAAIAVVVIHLTASAIGKYQQGSQLQFAVTFINGVALFAVPAFIFISAYTFMIVYRGKTLSFIHFFKKRIAVLLVPYLVWSLIYYFIQLRISAQPFSIAGFARCLLFGSAFYHLYFMPIIFQFYLLFIPLKRLAEHCSPVVLAALTLVLYYVYTSGLPFSETSTILGSLNHWLPLKSDFPMADRLFMSYLPFYMLGILLGQHAESFAGLLKKWAPLMILFYTATTGFHVSNRIAYYVYQKNLPLVLPYAWELSAIAAILMILWLTQKTEVYYKHSSAVPLLSSYTFDLYLAHPLVLLFGEYGLQKIGIHSTTLILIILMILGIGLPLLYAHLKKIIRIPLL